MTSWLKQPFHDCTMLSNFLLIVLKDTPLLIFFQSLIKSFFKLVSLCISSLEPLNRFQLITPSISLATTTTSPSVALPSAKPEEFCIHQIAILFQGVHHSHCSSRIPQIVSCIFHPCPRQWYCPHTLQPLYSLMWSKSHQFAFGKYFSVPRCLSALICKTIWRLEQTGIHNALWSVFSVILNTDE